MEISDFFIDGEPNYIASAGEIDAFSAAYQERIPVMLKGPTGCGKTRFVEHMAWKLKKPLITISCHEDMTASDIIGRYLLDSKGTYWLVTPVERGTIEVEDAPFIAVEVNVEKDNRSNGEIFVFRTNLDENVVCGPENPLRVQFEPSTEEPRPYILVRNGLEARLTRSVYYELVEMAIEQETEGQKVLGIWSKETFFPLGTIDDYYSP